MSLNFGQIGPPPTELAAFGCLNIPHRILIKEMMSPFFLGCFDPILLIHSGMSHALGGVRLSTRSEN